MDPWKTFLDSHRDVLDILDRVRRVETDAGQETRCEPETPVVGGDGVAGMEVSPDDVLADMPRRLGRFEVERLLGQGGFGLVFLARDPQLKRKVALKIPKPQAIMSTELRARFLREAEMAAALNHANIIPVFEAGYVDSVYYIASAFCPGDSLEQWVQRQGALPDPAQAAVWMMELADAVQHAHSREVVHRDLKPANILLRSDDPSRDSTARRWVPMITDFGLAKSFDQKAGITNSGSMIGTPAYMAPEQTDSQKHLPGPSSDIYALGGILYFMLVGQPPLRKATLLETIKAVQTEDPQLPRRIRATIPLDLQAICLKCLEKDPHNRYLSASGLRDDLHRFLQSKPVRARPISRLARLQRWARRNPALAASVGSLMSVIIVALIITSSLWIRSENLRRQSEHLQTLATDRSAQLEQFLDRVFSTVKRFPEWNLPGMEPLRQEFLREINHYYAELIASTPGESRLLQKRRDAIFRLAELKQTLGDYSGAIQLAQQSIEFLPEAPMRSSWQTFQRVRSLLLIAQAQQKLGRSQQQQSALDQALTEIRQEVSLANSPSDDQRIRLATTLIAAADILAASGQRQPSNELALESMAVWSRVDPSSILNSADQLAYGRTLMLVAKTHAASEKSELAREYAGRATEYLESLAETPNLNRMEWQQTLAEAYRTRGFSWLNDREQACSHFERADELFRDLALLHPLVPSYHRSVLYTAYQHALCFYVTAADDRAASYREAIVRLEQIVAAGIDLMRRFPDEIAATSRPIANSLSLLGIIYIELEDFTNALTTFEQSHALNQQIMEALGATEATQLQLAGATGSIGWAQMKLEQYDRAIHSLQDANQVLRTILADDPDNGEARRYLSNNQKFLAETYAATGQADRALRAFRRSLEDFAGDARNLQGELATYLMRAGEFDEARQVFNDYVDFVPCPDPELRVARWAAVMVEHLRGMEDSSWSQANRISRIDEFTQSAIDSIQALMDDPATDRTRFSERLAEASFQALRDVPRYQTWYSATFH